MRRDLVLAAALLASPLMVSADEKLESGCKAGDGVPAFAVIDVTGKYKTQTLCYIWKNGNKPVVLIFAREIGEDLASLVKEVDKVVNSSEGAESVVVHMVEDEKKSAETLTELAKAQGLLKVALTTNKTGTKGPSGLKLNDKAKYNVILYEKKKVVESFAFNKIGDEDRKSVAEAAKKLVGAKG